MEDDRSESRDSCYFPGCRKDANCNCEICLASINATLDLMPFSVQKSSLTKLSAPKPNLRSPVSFNPSIMSTPRSSTRRILQSPSLRSTARLSLQEKAKERKKERGFGFKFLRLVLGVSMVLAAEFGLSWVVSGVLRPELTTDMVRDVGEKCWVVQDLNGKLRFLQKELQGFVHGKVSNCSYIHSVWEMNQDGLLLHSRCTLFKSTTEEVSIWGWPLQTAGLLATGLSPRSFTILAGRVTEWSNGKVGYSIRKANSSWTCTTDQTTYKDTRLYLRTIYNLHGEGVCDFKTANAMPY
ncbi:hypothetical protein L1049_017417 [Liquidambar formosana]|uniref:Uncharacterized protein n=1 Tax=Liquidambar formosana TaxID=63359 RepID=A0AAP0S7X8_LIQFO